MKQKETKYIYLKIPVGEMSEEERVQVRGILKSFFTAIYKDLTQMSVKNTTFMLLERLGDKKQRKLILFSLMNFVKNHEKVALENFHRDFEGSLPSSSSTFKLMEISGGRE